MSCVFISGGASSIAWTEKGSAELSPHLDIRRRVVSSHRLSAVFIAPPLSAKMQVLLTPSSVSPPRRSLLLTPERSRGPFFFSFLLLLAPTARAAKALFAFGSCAKQYVEFQPWPTMDRFLVEDANVLGEDVDADPPDGKRDGPPLSCPTETPPPTGVTKLPWIWLGDASYQTGHDNVSTGHFDHAVATNWTAGSQHDHVSAGNEPGWSASLLDLLTQAGKFLMRFIHDDQLQSNMLGASGLGSTENVG